MQSNSRKGWTVSYNMMFKRLFGGLCLIWLIGVLFPAQVWAGDGSGVTVPEKASELLILHGESISEDELGELRILADIATSLGKSAELSTPEHIEHPLEEYEMILCYRLEEVKVAEPLVKTLMQGHTKLLLLGGTLFPECIQGIEPGTSVRCFFRKGETGVLRYDFSGQGDYEALVSLPAQIAWFDAPEERKDTRYESGTLEWEGRTVPFCTRIGNLGYIPLESLEEPLVQAALTREISFFLWDYAGFPPAKGQYLVLDRVYPYMPTVELLARVELLVESKIPFVLSVMPIYQNADYPAMQQFCEVLRYAQANGGAVILHAPILREMEMDGEELNRQMTLAITNLTDQGVYPLGVDVPYSWIWNQDRLDWMKRSRTAFVYRDTEPCDFSRETAKNWLYYNYHLLVMPLQELNEQAGNLVPQVSAAQRVGAEQPIQDLREVIADAQNNSNAYYSLWDSEQSLWADNFHLSWRKQALKINDTLCSTVYEPQPYPENYDYKRNLFDRFTMNIQNESEGLIMLVTVVTGLFLLMIGYARRKQYRHFLMESEKQGQKKRRQKRKEEP